MTTEIRRNPVDFLEAIDAFAPDLVVLDYHLGSVTGPELAAALRQSESRASLPILFLSTEADRGVQLRAVRAGGDEFLTKPISAEHLVAAVASRAGRGRALQELIERDGLTRLLNHAALVRGLEVELARARRTSQPVTFAMIDVDRFKGVNDRFGHAAGDRVLQRLGTLLGDRLRRTDLLGRYGGDEIAVVMPATAGPVARQVLEPIREQLALLELLPEGTRVTFSAGLATYPEHRTAQEVMAAADRALYRAKQAGRDRIVLDG